MTTVNVSGNVGQNILRACEVAGLPGPTAFSSGFGTQNCVLTWTPDLSAQDQATLQSIVKLATGATLITPAERTALEPDFVTLRAYANAASPTNAQSVAAIKSLINFVRAIVND